MGRRGEDWEEVEEKKSTPKKQVWFALKKTLHCRSEPSEVYDPRSKGNLGSILTRKGGRSGCSRSIANLKDVIHGSKRHLERPPSTCSPRSIGSSEFLNPITHEVILSNSTCELKITGCHDSGTGTSVGVGTTAGFTSTYVGTLKPGTPGPGGGGGFGGSLLYNSSLRGTIGATPPRKAPFTGSALSNAVFGEGGFGGVGIHRASSRSRTSDSNTANTVGCHKCGERFGKWEAMEAHHLSKHAGK